MKKFVKSIIVIIISLFFFVLGWILSNERGIEMCNMAIAITSSKIMINNSDLLINSINENDLNKLKEKIMLNAISNFDILKHNISNFSGNDTIARDKSFMLLTLGDLYKKSGNTDLSDQKYEEALREYKEIHGKHITIEELRSTYNKLNHKQ